MRVYTQTVKLAGTTLQRHLLPPNLRKAVNEEVAKAGNLPEDSPHRRIKLLALNKTPNLLRCFHHKIHPTLCIFTRIGNRESILIDALQGSIIRVKSLNSLFGISTD